jgi:hypothetical protein
MVLLCIFGFLFLLGGGSGISLLLFPHKAIDTSLKIYDGFGF